MTKNPFVNDFKKSVLDLAHYFLQVAVPAIIDKSQIITNFDFLSSYGSASGEVINEEKGEQNERNASNRSITESNPRVN